MSLLGKLTLPASEFFNKRGVYLGRRSTKVHVAVYRQDLAADARICGDLVEHGRGAEQQVVPQHDLAGMLGEVGERQARHDPDRGAGQQDSQPKDDPLSRHGSPSPISATTGEAA